MMRKSVGDRVWALTDLIQAFVLGVGFALMFSLISDLAYGAPIEHKFKSPSFSGINQSSHYLTIENQETSRKDALKQEIEDLQKQLDRDAENTTLAKFKKCRESDLLYTFQTTG